jgi:GrpB-like predicted nucleotidyltransferase (UPF0157 family)
VSDAWPTWATQVVAISEPDPAWGRQAAELCAGLERRLARSLDGLVEHVGSTAVPGLAAKPVIDLMAPVHSLVDSERADEVLAEAGWHLVPPELDQRPWRRMYVLPEGDRRLAHLHLVEPTHRQWRDVLLFRDQLRLQPELAAEYERIKRLAAQAHADDREAYTAAKSAFVHEVIRPDANRSAQRPISPQDE